MRKRKFLYPNQFSHRSDAIVSENGGLDRDTFFVLRWNHTVKTDPAYQCYGLEHPRRGERMLSDNKSYTLTSYEKKLFLLEHEISLHTRDMTTILSHEDVEAFLHEYEKCLKV